MESCALCGAGRARPFLKIAAVRLARCGCGFAFATSRSSEERYDEAYYRRWGTGSPREIALAAMKRRNYGRLLDFLEGAGARGGRLLDVGCGLGFSVEEALARGFDAYGIETSRFAADFASRRLPERVACGLLEDARHPDGRFDAVTLVDVIEHVRDPLSLLREIARIASPGGRLALTTPDLSSLSARVLGRRWPHFIPEHFSYFDRRTIARALERSGWRVRRLGKLRKNLRVDYVRGLLASRQDALGRAGAGVLAAVPGRIDLAFYTGDLAAVAQRI